MASESLFEDLVRRARNGEEEALREIARSYEADLRIAARVHLGPSLRPYLDSVDLVQSVHRSLIVGLRNDQFQLTNPGSLIALALTIVRRKVAHQWRRHRRQVRQSIADSAENPHDILASISCRQSNPTTQVDVRDAIDRLWQELDAEDRQLMEYRLQGFTTAEAAQQMGKTQEALRIRLHRLRKRLEHERILSEWL